MSIARKPGSRKGDRPTPPLAEAPRSDPPPRKKPAPSLSDQPGERIAKVLARAGVASRRDIEAMIAAGRVRLNGAVLTTPAVKVTEADAISVDGTPIHEPEPTRLWRFHKPPGYVTTHRDPEGRPTLFDILPPDLPRVISVGRLDLNSEGLILLTNDGELSRHLELPSSGYIRRYRARVLGAASQSDLDTLSDGVVIEGVRYGPIQAQFEPPPPGRAHAANRWVEVRIVEGKNREVRKALEHVGLRVNRLIRVAYGPFELGQLPLGIAHEVPARLIARQLKRPRPRPQA